MAHLDAPTTQRLERLRATDATGVYASEENAEGSDAGGAITLTVDPTLRVIAAEVLHAEGVRTPGLLAAAVASAYRAALAARLRPEAGQDAGRAASRPVALATPARRIAGKDELLHRHQTREATREERRAHRPRNGVVTGRSRNDCVWVTLAPASPRGTVDADPGWLAHTTASLLSAALTEAFDAAYSERDR